MAENLESIEKVLETKMIEHLKDYDLPVSVNSYRTRIDEHNGHVLCVGAGVPAVLLRDEKGQGVEFSVTISLIYAVHFEWLAKVDGSLEKNDKVKKNIHEIAETMDSNTVEGWFWDWEHYSVERIHPTPPEITGVIVRDSEFTIAEDSFEEETVPIDIEYIFPKE